jgi:hypothetical protein
MSATPDARHLPVGESSTGGYSPIVVLRTTPTPRTHSLHALIDVSHRLRPRDYVLACLLDEHTTLTTDQITTVLFANPTTCRHRLHTLRRIGFIDRFLRNRPGAANPICWVPGVLSARFVALARDDTPPTARALRERQDRIYASPKLEHLLAGNQFFVNLLNHARTHPGTGLLRWWSERSTAASYGQRIHPDGHGIWSEDDHTTGFFLELDRGSEFSGGRCPCRSPELRVSAAQRLMRQRYLPQHVSCKHLCGMSPVRVGVSKMRNVHKGCGAFGWAPHDGSMASRWALLSGRGLLSRRSRRAARRSGLARAWGPCRAACWGPCRAPSRDGHPNRPPRPGMLAAYCRCGPVDRVLRMTLRGLSCGGGQHA